jgi:tRNA (mo5U34)-methyltransferase
MKREEILEGLERLKPWFHRIDLGNGLYTKTESVMGEPVDHPLGPWQSIQKLLPSDLRGKTLLDVGCNAGFYAFEAKRRGAERVLGVDGQRQHVRQGLFVRKVLGLDVEFLRVNVYDVAPNTVGLFDITLALGLLYHLKHPMLALENLYKITTELLVIETAIMPPEQTRASFMHPLGDHQMFLHNLAFVENPSGAKEQVFNWFLPGIDALKAMLRTTGFDEVEVVEAKNERAIVVCRKTKSETQPQDELKHFVAHLKLLDGPQTCAAGSELVFLIRVQNTGLAYWFAEGEGKNGKGAITLGAHLLQMDETEVDWDYGRAPLWRDLRSRETAEIEFKVRAPQTPGSYIVEFDMVAEHISWFEDHGSEPLRLQLIVE